MGYKVKSNVDVVEEEINSRLSSLGITIELPIEEEKNEDLGQEEDE